MPQQLDDLSHDEAARILRDVVLGVPEPAEESPAAKEWRQKMIAAKEEAEAQGLMLDTPFDW